jgi:hypothetical protein
MSLIRFMPSNHPQQMQEGNGDAEKDERYTSPALIARLHAEWAFTVDAAGCAAAPSARLIGRYWDKATDGLAQDWDGERVRCNPPFSSAPAWVEKAWASRAVVVMLLPANRTEQPWWQQMVEPFRDLGAGGVLRTHFLATRISFGTPENPDGQQWASSPPFGCVLLIWQTATRDGPLSYHKPQLELVHR